jgi:hypothetical protein
MNKATLSQMDAQCNDGYASSPAGLSSTARARAPNAHVMEVQAQAALSVLAMTVQGAHDALQRAQTKVVPADAPASAHADVILELSAAAQSLVGGS